MRSLSVSIFFFRQFSWQPTHLVLLVTVLFPRLGVALAVPRDVRVSGSQAQSVVERSDHASTDANVEWDELKWEQQLSTTRADASEATKRS